MSLNTTTTLSTEYQDYFLERMTYYAVQEIQLPEYARREVLPKNKGSKQLDIFVWNAPSGDNILALTEGVAPATTTDLTLTKVQIPLSQYGGVAEITDVLSETEFFDSVEQASKRMGEDVAEKIDNLCRSELVVNAAAGSERFAQASASFAGLSAASTTDGAATLDDFAKAQVQLMNNRAKPFPGEGGPAYVALVSPAIAMDLRKDPKFIDVNKYARPERIFKGEVGMYSGVRFVMITRPFREANGVENTFASTGPIYSSLVVGQEAFATPELSSMKASNTELFINDQADKSDPLNQKIQVGTKFMWGVKILNTSNYFVNLRSKTTFA